jgi:hypothetical protein
VLGHSPPSGMVEKSGVATVETVVTTAAATATTTESARLLGRRRRREGGGLQEREAYRWPRVR